jgi:SAM-dependent methyltransferase
MAHRVCPWWLGYFLASPLRRFMYNPAVLLAPYVSQGMTVLEPGPGMGFYTLELALRVGPTGRVVAVDVQPQMIKGLKRRAAKARLLDRIDARLAAPDSLGVGDLSGVDFALACAVVHELPAAGPFFAEVLAALKPGAFLLLLEPKGHVKAAEFENELQAAAQAGFSMAGQPPVSRSYSALLKKG